MEDAGFAMEDTRLTLARITLKDSVQSKYFSHRSSGALLLDSEGGLLLDSYVKALYLIVKRNTKRSTIHDFSFAGLVLGYALDLVAEDLITRAEGHDDDSDEDFWMLAVTHYEPEGFEQFGYSENFKEELAKLTWFIYSRYEDPEDEIEDDEFVDEENNEDENNE